MALQLSVAVQNARLDAIETAIGTAPVLKIISGAMPANCAASTTGTVLASITLPSDWMSNAAAGAKALLGTWSASSILATGTAGYFRIFDSSGTTCHVQGTVGTSGTDMILDTTSFVSGATTVTVSTFGITDNNG